MSAGTPLRDPGPAPGDVPETGRSLTPTYIAVVVVEIVVLAALWALGAYFGT